jgi:GNAT superfamily N-acetyltransferase
MSHQGTNPYTIRAAAPADAPQLAALFQEAYLDSSHPCQDLAFVSQSLGGNRDFWLVALEGGAIVSCMAGVWHGWNRTYETCRSVTHPRHRTHGLGRRLYELCLAHLYDQGDCALTFGLPRTRAMYRLISEGLGSPFVLAGHDGGMNVANGRREYHLIGVTTNPVRIPHRAAPLADPLASSAFIETQILSRLTFITTARSYPEALIVGPRGTHHTAVGPWSIGFTYERASLARSLHITRLSGPPGDTAGALEGVAAVLKAGPAAEHVYAYVLSDKGSFVGGMRELGFQVTAYLPGWYCRHDNRYDCLMLAKSTSPERPVAHETADLIEFFDRGLNQAGLFDRQ